MAKVLQVSSAEPLAELPEPMARSHSAKVRTLLPSKLWTAPAPSWSPEEQVLTSTLQGIVAKTSPSLWIEGQGMYEFIAQQLAKEIGEEHVEHVTSVWSLLEIFGEHVSGYIVFNSEHKQSINIATSLCGPKHCVAVHESLLNKAQETLPREVKADASKVPDLMSVWREHKELFSRHGVLVLDPGIRLPARDLAVAQNLFTCYDLKGEDMEEIMNVCGPRAYVFGWAKEDELVHQASKVGAAVLASDYSLNLSVLCQLPIQTPASHRDPQKSAGEEHMATSNVETKEQDADGSAQVEKEGVRFQRRKRRTVGFVMSDGDNIQWMGGGFVSDKGFWASPLRGTLPMTWELAAALQDLAPRSIEHLKKTASSQDCFVAGISGAGYAFLDEVKDRKNFAQWSSQVLERAGLRCTSVMNVSGSHMEHCFELLEEENIDAVVFKGWLYDAGKGQILWHNVKPVVAYRYLLWENLGPDKTPEGVAEAISKLPLESSSLQDRFILINVHAWSWKGLGGPLAAVKKCMDLLPPDTDVVTLDQFLVRLKDEKVQEQEEEWQHVKQEEPSVPKSDVAEDEVKQESDREAFYFCCVS